MCGIKAAMEKVLTQKPMNEDQKQAVLDLWDANASVGEIIAFLQTIR